jgi:hypothetical protein
MKRALQTLLCAVAMIGCARAVELPLESVEMAEPVNGREGILPAPVDDVAVVDEEGAAGMSGYRDDEVPVLPPEPPAVGPAPEVNAACAGLAKLRARDGRITFNEDGSATVTVSLVNVTDEDMFEYPGLSARWDVAVSYASGDGGRFFSYGLFAGDHYEYTFQAPADVLQWAAGRLMTVYAEPFTLGTLDADLGCETFVLEFSALVPELTP